MFGIPSSEAVGIPVNQVVGADVHLSDRSELQRTDAAGTPHWVNATASPGDDGRTTLILRHVTSDREQRAELSRIRRDLEQSKSELEVKAMRDLLTGLANR